MSEDAAAALWSWLCPTFVGSAAPQADHGGMPSGGNTALKADYAQVVDITTESMHRCSGRGPWGCMDPLGPRRNNGPNIFPRL